MRKGFLILLCTIFVSVVSVNAQTRPAKVEQYNLVREGIGIEGITVGRSNMNDVIQKIGKNYRWQINKKYSYQMTYDRRGLSFYMCQEDKQKKIFLIEIKSPYKAKTSKGIILGRSTKEETEKVYGKPHDGFEYPGISFYYNKFGTRKLISEIDVVERKGIRQCVENKSDLKTVKNKTQKID